MARPNLDPAMATAIQAGLIMPIFLVMITFKSQIEYVWSGVGDLPWNGNTYKGVGSLGKIGGISESSEVQAEGTSVGLSAIDPLFLSESVADIQVGAPAKIWFGLWAGSGFFGQPYLLFSGSVDKPKVLMSTTEPAITLPLETKMMDLQRASLRRYTASDQHIDHPTDTAFNGVEAQNDKADRWGS